MRAGSLFCCCSWLLLLLLPLRAPRACSPCPHTTNGFAITFVVESSAEFAMSIEMGSSAMCPEHADRLARLERKQRERHRASSARMCACTIRCACVGAFVETPSSRLRCRPTSGGEGGWTLRKEGTMLAASCLLCA